MPSFGKASEAQWAAMRASSRMSTYSLFDRLQGTQLAVEDLRKHEQAALPDMLIAQWVVVVDGFVRIAPAGRRHLADG